MAGLVNLFSCATRSLGTWGIRLTCYYYRGAYYKAFWADPPACSIGEPRKSYWGERSSPLIMQNVHRYFLYLALIFILILAYDVWKAVWFVDPATGKRSFGIGLGTMVLAINVYLLGGYTFGCHSLRHLIGGFRDQLSRSKTCYRAYACELPESSPYALGVAKSVLGWIH